MHVCRFMCRGWGGQKMSFYEKIRKVMLHLVVSLTMDLVCSLMDLSWKLDS